LIENHFPDTKKLVESISH